MTTCAPLTDAPGAVQLTFFLVESPAKDSVELEKGSESSTPATSGQTRSASSKSAARRGTSSKTWTALLRSTIGASFSKTLRRQGTMLAGVCYPLEMWVLPTCESGSGCSQRIPTPCAGDGKNTANATCGRSNPNSKHVVGLTLVDFGRLWPTPAASLGDHGGRVTPSKAREGGTLIEALSARTRWPTPQALDGVKAPKCYAGGNPSLPFAAKTWPTPTASIGTSGAMDANLRKARGQTAGLHDAVRTWATPQARDHRTGAASAATHAKNSRPLSEQVGDLLNPTWVEWLMGWPIDWTNPDGGPSSEDFHAWLDLNRTALAAFVASATVKWPSARPQPGASSEVHDG